MFGLTHTVRDPVCQMAVNPKQTAWTSRFEGRDYAFCSENCKLQFETDPRQFVPDRVDVPGDS